MLVYKVPRLRHGFAGLLVLLFSACGALPTTAPTEALEDPLTGTRWVLTAMEGQAPLADAPVSIYFDAGAFSGNTGCNDYGSGYTVDGDRLRAEIAEITAMLCEPPEVMDQELAYYNLLIELLTGAGARFEVDNDRLVIFNALGANALEFARQETFAMNPADLLQTAWMLTSVNGQPVGAVPRRTMVFVSETEYSGFAGCRHFFGSYTAEGDSIRVPSMMMLGGDCGGNQELTRQESEYTDLISRAEQYYVQEGRLDLRTAQGDTAVFLPVLEETALETTDWRLVGFVDRSTGMDGSPIFPVEPLPGSEITLRIEDGSAAGSAGCNRYFSSFTLADKNLTFTAPGATKMFCGSPEGVMAQETAFLHLLPEIRAYRLLDDLLWLETGGSRALLFVLAETK